MLGLKLNHVSKRGHRPKRRNVLSMHYLQTWCTHIDGLVQERRNSSASAMELRLSCTNPLICENRTTPSWGLQMFLHQINARGPYHQYGSPLIPAWISNYGMVTPTSTAQRLKFGMDKWFHPAFDCPCDCLSMQWFKLIHVSCSNYGVTWIVLRNPHVVLQTLKLWWKVFPKSSGGQ